MAGKPSQEVPEVEVTDQSLELSSLVELDPSTLDPAYNYRWAHKTPLKVARLRAKGYEIVKPEEVEIKNAVGDSPESEDGTYTVGDLVLMRCKKQIHRARRHKIAKKTTQRLKGPEKKFRRTAKEKGRARGLDIEVITDKE